MGVDVDTAVDPTVASRLLRWHRITPEKPAFVFITEAAGGAKVRPDTLTCAQLYTKAALRADYLRSQFGIGPHDVVCNTLPNSPERVITDMAIILAGAVMLNAPRTFDSDDLRRQFCDYLLRLDVLLIVFTRTDPLSTAIVRQAVEMKIALYCVDCVYATDVEEITSDLPAMLNEETRARMLNIRRDNLAVLWATRGRGGHLRVVGHSHRSVLEIGKQFQKHLLQLERKDVYFCSAGLGSLCGFPALFLETGVTTVVENEIVCRVNDKRDHSSASLLPRPLLSWNMLMRHSCTRAFFTTHDIERYYDARQLPRDFRQRKLKRVVIAGDSVKPALVKALHGPVAKEVLVAYCTAELGVVAYSERSDIPFEESDRLLLTKHTEVVTKDLFHGCVLEKGRRGLLAIKNDSMKPQLVADLRTNMDRLGMLLDWIPTEDLGQLTSDGSLILLGRIDVAEAKALQVCMEEDEWYLRGWVEGISDAAMVLYKLEGEPLEIVGCLTLDDGEWPDSAREKCKEFMEHMEGQKATRFIIFDAFPKTPSGFVDRRQLQDFVAIDIKSEAAFNWRWRPTVKRISREEDCCCYSVKHDAKCVIL